MSPVAFWQPGFLSIVLITQYPLNCYHIAKLVLTEGASMLTRDSIKGVLHDVLKDYDIKEAYLFGSYARGDQSVESDVDIRLLCGHDIRIQDLMDIEDLLTSRLGISVDIVSAEPRHLRKRFYDEISKDEVLLYAAQ